MALSIVLLITLWVSVCRLDTTVFQIQTAEPINRSLSGNIFLLSKNFRDSLKNFQTSQSLFLSPPSFFSILTASLVLFLFISGFFVILGYSYAKYKKGRISKKLSPMSPISVCSTSLPSISSPKTSEISDSPSGLFLNDFSSGLMENENYFKNFEEVKILRKSNEETVYLARHRLDIEEYLVKAIAISSENSIRDSKLFQEINKVKKINCRHLARYVTCWVELSKQTDLAYFYVQMEYIKGETLQTWLEKDFTKAQGVKLVRQVCKIVKYLHSLDIFHGNLSIGNMFIDKNGYLIIGDFDLKKCFCDDLRNVVQLIKLIFGKLGDSELFVFDVLKIPFVVDRGLSDCLLELVNR